MQKWLHNTTKQCHDIPFPTSAPVTNALGTELGFGISGGVLIIIIVVLVLVVARRRRRGQHAIAVAAADYDPLADDDFGKTMRMCGAALGN